MTISYRNFWSMNIDEAIVTGILRSYFKKEAEIFMPLNSQMKGIDLAISNLKNKKLITIQVKGSKAYEPTKREKHDFVYGSGGWFFIKEEIIKDCPADYFIFLIYVIIENSENGRRNIEPHVLTIRPKELYQICKENKILHKNYSFYIWVNPKDKKCFDHRDEKQKGIITLDKYLDELGLEQIKKEF